jgi:uncharacterized protein YciI
MKTFFPTCIFLLISTALLSQKPADIEAIKEVISLESDMFYARNFEAWASCYLQTDDVYWSCIEEDGLILEARSWRELAPFVGGYLQANPEPLPIQIERENFEFRKYGKAVWVAFDEYQNSEGEKKNLRGIRILEKKKGKWKIVYMNSYPKPVLAEKKEASFYNTKLAKRLGADEYGMKSYVIAFLKTGPTPSKDKETAARLQKAHLDNIRRMAEMGKLVLAGPFMDDGDIRGIYVFDVATLEEARELTHSDPSIRAGALEMELHPWYGSAALPELLKIHEKITLKSF